MINLGHGWKVETVAHKFRYGQVNFAHQVHGDKIVYGGGDYIKQSADGLWINSPDESAIAVRTADCLPLALVTDSMGIALHVSRKSLARGLLIRSAEILGGREVIGAYLGPHICEKHFYFEEIGEELDRLIDLYPRGTTYVNGRTHVSLRKIVRLWLGEIGVSPDGVVEDFRCTYEQLDLPSYRRNKACLSSEDHLITVLKWSA